MKSWRWILLIPAAILWPAASSHAQTTKGAVIFEQKCATCHGNPASAKPAPDFLSLWKLSADDIYAAREKAPHASAASITDDDWKETAFYMGRRRVGIEKITDAKLMLNPCPGNSPLGDINAKPMWNGWGNGVSNARFQNAKEAGLTAAQVPNLKLKWAFGFPGAEEVYGQPTIAGGRVFLGVDTGAVYSLDAESGCVYWSYQADGGVRTAISIGPVKGKGATKYGVYFGDIRANVYMLDASTGKEIWKVQVDDHPVAKITGAPMLYEDRLYVPVSSQEERSAGWSTIYPCCTFRGSVVALDATSGKTIWKTYPVADPPKPTVKTANGVQQYGPNGGAVWNTPTIDAKSHALYVGTGDAYTKPVSPNTDAIMALDLKTGKVMWSVQDTQEDAWISGCGGEIKSENCLPPSEIGPDYDFGASPILKNLPNGHRMLVAGQKSGMVWGHDPDRDGTVAWKAQLVKKLALGMITFGGAADDQYAYFGLRTGGVAAVKIDTGEQKWFTPVEPTPGPGPKGENAALTAIPGVIFSGGWDGMLRAFASDDGHLLWEYNMVRDYETVNHVPARGGSMAAAGPTVAGGMLFVGSGYVFGAGTAGNALLVFSAQ
ncbi:MAG TPA: PQQ-binding-like beta-propeller repeat protein [Verrucomicrobiae bacterium]|nr:PQQ-binding-like beta-propeller repeat protein [Verrucomicrobiae bacterium]